MGLLRTVCGVVVIALPRDRVLWRLVKLQHRASALLLLAPMLLSVPAQAQTVGTRHVQFVYITYAENRTHHGEPIATNAAGLVRSLNDTYGRASYGNKLRFTHEVHGYIDLPVSRATYSDCNTFKARIANAIPVAWPTVAGSIRVIAYPPRSPCYPSAGIRGTVISLTTFSGFIHEMGHILGMPHAQALARNGTVQQIREYGDLYDLMGNGSWNGYGRYAQFRSPSKEKMGWFSATHRLDTVTTSQTVTLIAYETQDAGLKAVKARRTEYRPVFGRPEPIAIHHDTYLEYMAGAQTPGVPLRSTLQHLDLDLGPEERWVLPQGQPVTENGITYTLLSMTADRATVRIDFPSSVSAPPAGGRPVLKE